MAQPSSATPAAEPQPDPEKRWDRIVTWRAALLSAGVVLMAGLVGAASSYIVATKQIESQTAQAQDEFLRTQRQVIYSKFVADEGNLWQQIGECKVEVTTRPLPLSQADQKVVSDKVTPSLLAQRADLASVAVIGGRDVAVAADKLYRNDFTYFGLCLGVASSGADAMTYFDKDAGIKFASVREDLIEEFTSAAAAEIRGK